MERKWKIDGKKWGYGLAIGAVLLGIVIWGIVRQQQKRDALLTPVEPAGNTSAVQETTSTKVLVHVAGAVNNPGVYTLDGGSRVIDAVDAAGGLSPEADGDALNLAAVVEDAAKITIPTIHTGEEEGGGSISSSGLVNINTADKTTLMTLSGIGEVLAQNIIDYRTKNGSFTNLEELKNVNRIGDKLFEQIKDGITL
ncbi:ComEA family DNA-binding protein [Eubacterium barkeri]|uniref:Competence protein ComEA n=1 Tax=Eubacterium barkeri TaxID=1528 RepID=A0A1H3CJI0_EUBBA|nr:ComEA family DNA-binding protein [Eubacterium barkeri]SDX53754.1 competence protein ComEA [Eubacterium barkeri]